MVFDNLQSENFPTMCPPKFYRLIFVSVLYFIQFPIEAIPIAKLNPNERTLVEKCLRNCQICETNFVDFLEGEFCRDTCVKGRGLIQKVRFLYDRLAHITYNLLDINLMKLSSALGSKFH